MVAPHAPLEPLLPETAGRLAEFAKACKAATRIVSMYPTTHPAIQSALARIAAAAAQATNNGPFTITVLPDALLVGGRGFAKPEPSVTELAQLLHLHLIRELTLLDRLDNDGWHTFLALLAKSPEDARIVGGVVKAWHDTGINAIALTEIDYAEVLRERGGSSGDVTWERILAVLDESQQRDERIGVGHSIQDLMVLAESPERLAEFAQRLQDAGKASGDDSIQQRKSLTELMYGLATYAAERKPEELDTVLNRMAAAASQMSPELLLTLITDPPPMPGGAAGSFKLDFGKELQRRLTDDLVSRFLLTNILKNRGATDRLAAAFQTLVPDPFKQLEILAAASERARSLFKDDPEFQQVWATSTQTLMSYSDAKFVPEDYARELTRAQSQAMEVDKIGDDPPARIRAWLATIRGEEIRAIEQRLLLDLLRIERRPDAWSGVLDSALAEIDALVQAGDLPLAAQLLDALAVISRDPASPFTDLARAGMARLAEGPLVRDLAVVLRQATDAEFGIAQQMCTTIGPVLVKPLSDAIMGEDNPKTVRRLRDILISFGQAAREYANELRSSRNPTVRRAAVDLLRALGGDAALPDLRTLLDDADAQVQREALRAIVQVGTHAAYRLLEQALRSGAAHTRDAIQQSLSAFRDEKATPLFVHVLMNTPRTGPTEPMYLQAIESLGRVATDERSVEILKDLLYRGEWWARARTFRLRSTVARALRSMGRPSADRVLEEAAASGPFGVRRIARAALAEPAAARRAAPRSEP